MNLVNQQKKWDQDMELKTNRIDNPCMFKASVGWMLNFFHFVLRRMTTTGRKLPGDSIDTILSR